MGMNADLKKRWIDALRSGNYKQGRTRLRSIDNAYCCLGVLCDVYDPARWSLNSTRSSRYLFNGAGAHPPYAVRKEIGISYDVCSDLIDMNDGEKKSFSEIADWIEQQENL